MMTVLSPCRRCARKGTCERLADLRKSLRGSGVTKASVKCGIPATDFPVGQPVAVRCFDLDYGGHNSEDFCRVNVTREGVVMNYRAGKFRVLLNVGQEVGAPEDGTIAILGVYPDQLSRIEGKDTPVELCGCGLTQDRCEDRTKLPRIRDGDWQCWEDRVG